MKKVAHFGLLRSVLGAWALGVALVLGVAAPLWAQSKIATADELQQALAQSGSARVLVQLNFPDYTEHLAAARAFGVVAPEAPASPATVSAQAQADEALASAVAAAAAALPSQAAGGAVQLLHAFRTIPYGVYQVDAAGLQALAALPQVLSIRQDQARPRPEPTPVATVGDAPLLTDSVPLIGADNLWAQGYTGSGWYVAVLDDGIRPTHEMFSGKSIVEACFTSRNADENPSARLCPNGQTAMYGSGAAAHYDGEYHGSHVAGIAAGKADSLKGVAPDAGVVAVQIFSDGFADDETLTYDSDQLRGLEYVYSLRSTYSIASVNMSLGGGNYSTFCDDSSLKSAIDNLRAAGIPTTISTGNASDCDGVSAPSCISSAYAIGSSDKSDVISSFSNFYDSLTPLFAPGSAIKSAVGESDTSYETWSGTSMAAPHVAGAFALLRSVDGTASATTLGNALKNTAKPVSFNRCTRPSNVNRRIQVDLAAAQLNTTPVSGQSDIWWGNAFSGANTVWYMGKLQKTGETSLFAAPPELTPVCFGDFNGNGETDGFWRNKSTGANFVVYMNKGSYVSHASFNAIPTAWQVAGCADFNSDHNVDVYWHNTETGASGVTYLNGSGQWVGTAYGPDIPSGWYLRGVGDFNQDGKPDLLAHDPSNGQTVIGLMNGVSLQSKVFVGAFDTGYAPKGTGKFTSADNVDILWRSQSHGKNAILSMNGTAYSSYTIIDDVSSQEWDICGAGAFK